MAGWIIAGLGLIALGEGAALFVMPYLRPAAAVIEVKSPSPAEAATVAPAVAQPPALAQAAAGSVAVTGTDAPAPKTDGTALPSTTPAPVVAAGPRFGGMTVTSPVDLQVFKDGQVVGSTAGQIAMNEGFHNLEFVNDTLGFRLRQTVSVKNGQMTSVKIAVPNGRISINAVPWADVFIDGTAAGETPLANLSLPIGTHEIIFRHPQLGERKQTVVVKVDGLVRVTQSLQQDKN